MGGVSSKFYGIDRYQTLLKEIPEALNKYTHPNNVMQVSKHSWKVFISEEDPEFNTIISWLVLNEVTHEICVIKNHPEASWVSISI